MVAAQHRTGRWQGRGRHSRYRGVGHDHGRVLRSRCGDRFGCERDAPGSFRKSLAKSRGIRKRQGNQRNRRRWQRVHRRCPRDQCDCPERENRERKSCRRRRRRSRHRRGGCDRSDRQQWHRRIRSRLAGANHGLEVFDQRWHRCDVRRNRVYGLRGGAGSENHQRELWEFVSIRRGNGRHPANQECRDRFRHFCRKRRFEQ